MQDDENLAGFESLTIQESENGADISTDSVLENSNVGNDESGIELYILIQQASGLVIEEAAEICSFVSIQQGEKKVSYLQNCSINVHPFASPII